MHDFMNITKALSDRNRVRVLMALRGRELCVCQIVEFLGLAPSTVSKHMSILRNARLVECRKEGLWIHCQLPHDPNPVVRKAIEWVCSSLEADETVKKDNAHLKKILKMDLDDICKRQNGRTCCKTKRRNNNGK